MGESCNKGEITRYDVTGHVLHVESVKKTSCEGIRYFEHMGVYKTAREKINCNFGRW